jgi:hypothetical protein
MTLGGWLVMIVSVGTVTGLFIWCIYKVMTEKKTDDHHIHGLDIETPDQPRR